MLIHYLMRRVAQDKTERLEDEASLRANGDPRIEPANRITDLLNSHGERLYRLLVRLTLREDVADDLLQDLVVKLSQARGFATAAQPYAYARRAAMNLAFSWLRGRRPEVALDGHECAVREDPPWSRLVKNEDIQQLLDQMMKLNEQDRQILAMRYFDEAGYADISGVIGCTAHQARGLCHKAVERLRIAMTRGNDSQSKWRKEVGR